MAGGTKVNARDAIYEVDNGSATYLQIGDLHTATFDRTSTEADTTVFASQGQKERFVNERDATLKLVGKRTGDTGQNRCDVLGDLVGAASVGLFRITWPKKTGQTVVGDKWAFNATVDLDSVGGANNDPLTWGATIKKSGGVTVTAGS